MRKILLAVCCAALLSGCSLLTHSTRPSSPPPPPPPPANALIPCLPTAQHRQADGSALASDDEATIRDGRFDLKACDAERQLLVDAWPAAAKK